ncbi:MAG: arabinose isomerase, partial [Bacteroidia bacterium]|nr:arabinose isomerase [Bacteroidia bacterium]
MNKIEKITIPQREKSSSQRIGVFGVGYERYWDQFPGLLDELLEKQSTIIKKIPDQNAAVIDFGMVDNADKAYELVKLLEAANLDLIFCNMLTYATSSTFGIIIKTVNTPIVLVALQPRQALDYSKASTYMQLANDDICSLPEFTGIALRMGKPVPNTVIGTLHDDPEADRQIDEYCRIAKVLHDLKNAHFGHLGHPINAMLDMHTDASTLTSVFGCHVVECEANELMRFYYQVTEEEIVAEEKLIQD